MSFNFTPPYLFLGGTVVRSDLHAWREALRLYDRDIEIVVLHDSPGGDSFTSRVIAREIRGRGLTTVAYGRCASACSSIFLGGAQRQFASPRRRINHILVFHGSYDKITGELNRERLPDFFVEMTGGMMSPEFVRRFIELEHRGSGLHFAPKKGYVAAPSAQLCIASDGPSGRERNCEAITNSDALSTGVVTTWTTRSIDQVPEPPKIRITTVSW